MEKRISKKFSGGAKIEIDKDICESCKMCVNVCYVDVIRWDAEEKKPVVAYPEDCAWCLFCEENCPVGCIEVIPVC